MYFISIIWRLTRGGRRGRHVQRERERVPHIRLEPFHSGPHVRPMPVPGGQPQGERLLGKGRQGTGLKGLVEGLKGFRVLGSAEWVGQKGSRNRQGWRVQSLVWQTAGLRDGS